MKLKISFPAKLRPFGKDKNTNENISNDPDSTVIPELLHPYAGEYMAGVIVLLMTLLLLSLNGDGMAQSKKTERLNIGDKVPDLTLDQIVNYPTKTAKLSDFKGKLLILDFWATWCSPCMAMIPKMDSLQKEFDGKIQFLPVAYQGEKEIFSFLEKLQKQKGASFNIPEVIADRKLQLLFPHQVLPHYVWIDREGVVKAITEAKEVSRATIQSFLLNQPINLREKKETASIYNNSQPLFLSRFENQSARYGHSILTGYIDGLSTGSYKDLKVESDSSYKRITAHNIDLLDLYQLVYSENGDLPRSRIILNVNDKNLFDTDKTGMEFTDWLKAGNGYCYELMIPTARAAEGYSMAQQDLKKYFPNYSASWEQRKIQCWSLERIPEINGLATKGGVPMANFDSFGATLQNCYLRVLLSRLEYYLQNSLPLYDNTHYAGFADIQINGSLSSIENLNKELNRYGLRFTKAERSMPVLVIRDAPVQVMN